MIERISVFQSKNEILTFFVFTLFIFCYTLLLEYQNYKQLTQFDSILIEAKVLTQYEKTKNGRTYQVLKLKANKGYSFYTTAKNSLQDVTEKTLSLELFAANKSFYEYLSGFYAFSKILSIEPSISLKEKLNRSIESEHNNTEVASIYKALYTATPLQKHLYGVFSTLGVSHLLAISGFHLGVLSMLLFFLLRPPYLFLQNRYFPYSHANRDLFLTVLFLLLCYLVFLEAPPSLLRAFGMLGIGFILFDRGYKIISMQTLLLSVIVLIALFPRLVFSLGFWLSVSGVFYIFLFFFHYKELSKRKQFVLLPLWLYIMMLPFSLAIFENFSLLHPLSIIWTALFTLFYPLSILMHLLGLGSSFDALLEMLISLGQNSHMVVLPYEYLALHIVLSFAAIYKKAFIPLLTLCSTFVLIYAIYNVA